MQTENTKEIESGEYELYVKIGGGDKPTVKLAMDVEKYNDAYKLFNLTIE